MAAPGRSSQILAEPLWFHVPGEPRGKGRPRIVKIGGFSRLTADEKTRAYEGSWSAIAHNAMAGRPLMEGPLSVGIVATFLPPKSASKVKRQAMIEGRIRPTRKPDLDNIAKCMDSLNGVVWIDDAQVVQLLVSKAYGLQPGVTVTIYPTVTPEAAAAAEAA